MKESEQATWTHEQDRFEGSLQTTAAFSDCLSVEDLTALIADANDKGADRENGLARITLMAKFTSLL